MYTTLVGYKYDGDAPRRSGWSGLLGDWPYTKFCEDGASGFVLAPHRSTALSVFDDVRRCHSVQALHLLA